MRRCYAKQLREGPVFRFDRETGIVLGKGKGIGWRWRYIGTFGERKYALMMMKAITMAARRTK